MTQTLHVYIKKIHIKLDIVLACVYKENTY